MKTRGKKAKEVKLPAYAEQYLRKIANSGKYERRYFDRAKIVLGANEGQTNLAISKETGIGEKTVIKWRTRYRIDGCHRGGSVSLLSGGAE